MSDGHDPRNDRLRRRVRDSLDSIYRPAPDLARRSADAVARDRKRRRLAAPLGWIALTVVTVAALVLVLVQHVSNQNTQGPVVTPKPTVSPRQSLYALTAANEVIALDRATLAVRWRTGVAAPPSAAIAPGSMLAVSRDGGVLYVLPPSQNSGGTTLVLLDATTGRRLVSIPLSASGGAIYRTLAVDPHSGTVDVVGQDASHLLVTEVDPQRRVLLASHATRTLPPVTRVGPGILGAATFTADGTRLYYSYVAPSPDRSGIDWVAVSGPRLSPCTSTGAAACIPAGVQGFALAGGHVVFSDGTLPPHLVETDLEGHVLRQLPTGISEPGSSVLTDASGSRVFVVATCDNLGGVSSIDLTSGQPRAIATPAPDGTQPGPASSCGERAALLSASTIALTQLPGASAHPDSPGSLIVVDTTTGNVTRSAAFPAEVADVLAPT